MMQWALDLHESDATIDQMAGHHPSVESNESYLKGKRQWFHDYVTNQQKRDDYWNSSTYKTLRNAHKNAKVPVLMRGAWHDFFLDGQFDVFEELPTRSQSVFSIRNGHHAHSNSLVEFRDNQRFNFTMMLDWFDVHLKGKSVRSLPESGYVIQSNVNNGRTHFSSWPANTSRSLFYLGNLNSAGSCDGGTLLVEKPTSAVSVSYIYDPENPVESRGGAFNLVKGGVIEQGNVICARDDVISFESSVFEEAFTLSGSIKVAIKVSSDANDSAFTVKVQEKLADGSVYNIREGITSLSFRNGLDYKQKYEADSIVELEFDLTRISWEFRPGSSLRLDISSSSYPMFNAHPNVEENGALVASPIKARQTIFSGKLSLPVR
ncbi:MAG: CocE/NonD family hydrolase [Halioglobus sp.]